MVALSDKVSDTENIGQFVMTWECYCQILFDTGIIKNVELVEYRLKGPTGYQKNTLSVIRRTKIQPK